jgi:hypothetical protein
MESFIMACLLKKVGCAQTVCSAPHILIFTSHGLTVFDDRMAAAWQHRGQDNDSERANASGYDGLEGGTRSTLGSQFCAHVGKTGLKTPCAANQFHAKKTRRPVTR